MLKWVKNLGITFPTQKEAAALTVATAALMLAGGMALFLIDSACLYLYALIG